MMNKLRDLLRKILAPSPKAHEKSEPKYKDKLYEIKEHIYSDIYELKKQIQSETEKRESLQEEIHNYLAIQSLGLDPNSVPLSRFLPVRVYLTTSSRLQVTEVSNAITNFLSSLGFDISDSFPPQQGSWWKKWFAKSKEALTHSEVTDRLKKGERALELYTLQKYQSNIDKEQAEAAGTILRSLENIPNAVCQIGSILVIKVTDDFSGTRVYTRSLTPQELIYLERNQHLLQSPETILEALSQHCATFIEISPNDDRADD